MAHYGEIGKRVTLTLKLVGEYEYATHFNWVTTTHYIYTFLDDAENCFVWKTTSYLLGIESTNERGDWAFDRMQKRDTAVIKATIKAHSEYNGTEQTELARVKVISIDHAEPLPTKEELDAKRREEQMASLLEGDFLWEMPYTQYKAHYSDCETIAGSYKGGDIRTHERPRITVIIREGRLVPSGTRGKRYMSYFFETEPEQKVAYYAVSEETARRRFEKDYPQYKGNECVEILDTHTHRIW